MPDPKRVSRPLLEAMLLSEYARHLEQVDPPSARMRCMIAQYKQALIDEARQSCQPAGGMQDAPALAEPEP